MSIEEGSLSPSFIDRYMGDAREIWSFTVDCYEIFRQEIVASIRTKVSPAHAVLIDRISRSVASIFVALCALSGSKVVIAAIVLVIHRGSVLYEFVRQAVLSGASKEVLLRELKKVGKEYKRALSEELAPALLVAFSVDTIFCFVLGIGLPSLRLLLRAAVVSLSITYFWYNTLVEQCKAVAGKA